MDNDFDKVKIRDRLVPWILIAVDLHLSRGAELGSGISSTAAKRLTMVLHIRKRGYNAQSHIDRYSKCGQARGQP